MDKTAKERAEFFDDCLITALEGGIQYWAYVRNYRPHWNPDFHSDHPRNMEPTTADVIDADSEKAYHVTPATIRLAFSRIRGKNPIQYLHDKTRARLRACYHSLDGGEIDASDADILLQIGIFGHLIYG